jgi:membrane protein implicated in regulation of membrane protease activity
MSSIATSLDPGHRGQITGLATFTKFLGMGVGALIFQRLIGLSFRTALIVFATIEILAGLAAIYGLRKEGSRKNRESENEVQKVADAQPTSFIGSLRDW